MKKWLTCVAGLLLLTVSAAAQAPEHYGPKKGQHLAFAAGTISTFTVDSFSTTLISGQVGIGRFLTDIHEVGAVLATTFAHPEDGDNAYSHSLSAYYNYNWRYDSRLWFYAGPHLGVNRFEAQDDGDWSLTIGAHGGARYWLSPRTAVFAEPRLTSGSDISIREVVFGVTVVL